MTVLQIIDDDILSDILSSYDVDLVRIVNRVFVLLVNEVCLVLIFVRFMYSLEIYFKLDGIFDRFRSLKYHGMLLNLDNSMLLNLYNSFTEFRIY